MSEARSLTPLSETDYEAIEAAVMETARGRWFMAEYARRNRQADTQQLLGAINRIERIVGLGLPEPAAEPDVSEAAALIADLRIDLERISGKGEDRASGLASRIETAAGSIVQATESMQEAAWSLREAGANEALCDMLDQRAAEISAATMIVEGTAQRIDKIADTIAMLDSSLRAVTAMGPTTPLHDEPFMAEAKLGRDIGMPSPPPLGSYHDIEIVEIDSHPAPVAASKRSTVELLGAEPRIGSIQLDDDIVFSDAPEEQPLDVIDQSSALAAFQQRLAGNEVPAKAGLPGAGSEGGLRELDALPADKKVAYFA
ncbi:MAG TPA: hypothetical protein VGN82_18550 [Bosea sp. (in: a-proteobacteria)]|uniref:hypothetical protein n=1 Tax=Bosea sp. (in: a-proteobacteria) TaxID=1871050 RepID=UPI002E0F0C1E|nr:hypothetical protein [Bosea sp. (in: a-proteobacteria)]